MRTFITLINLVLLVSSTVIGYAQDQYAREQTNEFKYRKVNNNAFRAGEFLKYKLAYGFITAGEATVEVKAIEEKIQGRDILMVKGRGYSISAFDWFFKVRDQYDTYLDAEGVFPWLFVRRIEEGGYKKKQDYKFFQNEGRVKDVRKEKEYIIPHGIQDMVSSFYYARTIDFSKAEKNQIFTFNAFVDGEVIPIRIRYAGTKTVKVNAGKFECMVFHPAVQEGRIFENDEALTVYITKDENKIPILAKAKVIVGSIRVELVEFRNLANPMAKR